VTECDDALIECECEGECDSDDNECIGICETDADDCESEC
jgi:hypothetical protein